MLHRTALEEYQKALIFETLKAEAKTVREIAAQTGLPVYTVSLRLNDLERTGLAAYLVFTVLDWWAPGVAADCGLAPILLGVLFYLTGLFGVENSERAPENITV